MLNNNPESTTKLVNFLDRANRLLNQRWSYQLVLPTMPMQRPPPTECEDLLALLSELVGELQRAGDGYAALANGAEELGLSRDAIKRAAGIDLCKLAVAYKNLAEEVAGAVNRALDLIGEESHG